MISLADLTPEMQKAAVLLAGATPSNSAAALPAGAGVSPGIPAKADVGAGADVLAGIPFRPVAPVSLSVKPPISDDMRTQFMREANKISANDPNAAAPGAWARALVAGTQNALAGVGAIGEVPKGGGALYGIGKVMQYRKEQSDKAQARADAQKQQDKVNAREDARLKSDLAVNDVRIEEAKGNLAEATTSKMHQSLMIRDLSEGDARARVTADQTDAQIFKNEHAQTLHSKIDSDTAQKMIQEGKLNGHTVVGFLDGWTPMLDADGKERTNPETGEVIGRYTYEILGPVPEVRYDKDQCDLLNKYHPSPNGSKYAVGTVVSGDQAARDLATARANETAALGVEKTKAEIEHEKSGAEAEAWRAKEEKLTYQQKLQNEQLLRDPAFVKARAEANGDDVAMYSMLAASGKKEDLDLLGRIDQLFGPGELAKLRQQEIANLSKVVDENQKAIADSARPGAVALSDEEMAERNSQIAGARWELKKLIPGLANTPGAEGVVNVIPTAAPAPSSVAAAEVDKRLQAQQVQADTAKQQAITKWNQRPVLFIEPLGGGLETRIEPLIETLNTPTQPVGGVGQIEDAETYIRNDPEAMKLENGQRRADIRMRFQELGKAKQIIAAQSLAKTQPTGATRVQDPQGNIRVVPNNRLVMILQTLGGTIVGPK